MGTLAILDRRAGDITVGWDKNNPDEIENAQATFDDMRAKGHLAYVLDKDGKKGQQIKKFDPSVERIILTPALVGG